MAMNPARIEVEIGELVLAGFPVSQRHQIGEAVRSEIERLLGASGLPAGLSAAGEVDRLDAGRVRLPDGAGAAMTGRRIGGAVYTGLGR